MKASVDCGGGTRIKIMHENKFFIYDHELIPHISFKFSLLSNQQNLKTDCGCMTVHHQMLTYEMLASSNDKLKSETNSDFVSTGDQGWAV